MPTEIRKKTHNLGALAIKPIGKDTARCLTLAHHYSHTWRPNFGRYCYGLFRDGQEDEPQCLGIAAFGCMKTPKARIFESALPNGWMCELNRFWVSDELGKNAESLFLAAALRLLHQTDRQIVAVQTFADSRCGSGTIYKATNFHYYGYHYTVFLKHLRSGETIHEQVLTNAASPASMARANISLLAGDLKAFEVKTHRYIYPLHKSFQFTGNGTRQAYPPPEQGTTEIPYVINAKLLQPRLAAALAQLLQRYPHTREKRLAQRHVLSK